MRFVEKLVKHLSRYILPYTLLSIVLGTLVSYFYSPKFLSRYIMVVVFLMIYPMMVNVTFESLKKIKRTFKVVLVGVLMNFVFAPLLYWLLCVLFNVPMDVKVALILLAIAPASSMGLGYVGLSEGNMVSASAIVATAFLLSLGAYPLTLYLLNAGQEIVPFREVIRALILVLLIPLALGVFTREVLIESRGIDFKKVKPYFSLATLLFLYVLMFMIFAVKGNMMIKHWDRVVLMTPVVILFYAVMILVAIVLNRYILKLSYEDNQAVVFTTVSKNVSLTIGILAMVFCSKGNATMAMYPAIVSIFQIIFLMLYLHLSRKVKEWWVKG